ncbi:H/ACA ribonucleoprotein complex non-core subunit NAF1 isoform X2 [Trichomycterus rosablanca]|uniref:H/ACA ribonucleoprotein complex non-core subunit NAF1 isoform X2 n=1 Tax=Trichomycterus rosablanca TaxID=2290929 RepID=UPI002F358276
METTDTEDLFTKAELDAKANEKPSPEQEKPDEPDADITTVRAVQQDSNIVPETGTAESTPGLNKDTETGVTDNGDVVPETGTAESTPGVNKDIETSVTDHGDVVPETGTAESTPGLNKDTETGVTDNGDVVPETGTAESTPGVNKDIETSVTDHGESQHHQAQSGPLQQDSESHKAGLELNIAEDTGMSMKGHECFDFQSASVNEDTGGPASGEGGSLALLSMQYRDESLEDLSDSDSDSSSSTSSSSSSSSSPVVSVVNDLDRGEDDDGNAPGKRPPAPVKTQDEDLPAVENLTISLPEETEMESIGIISGIIDQLVIVESKKDSPPINDESVLFNKNRLSIGKVFEVFGPVCQPYYVLRFNSQEEIEQKDLKIRDPVFFAPKIKDFTGYIFVEQIKQMKGSDASWKNDQEPPPEALDFSDDEKERLSKQKQKQQKRSQKQNLEDSDSDTESSSRPPPSQKPPRRKPRQNWNSQRGRPAHHNPHPGFYTNCQVNPHFRPDYMIPPPAPFQPPFQGHSYSPYLRAPAPHMGHWHPGPYPGPMFYPPPPPPPPPPPSH